MEFGVLLKLDLKEGKFLILLRTHTAAGEPKAAKNSSMNPLLGISLLPPVYSEAVVSKLHGPFMCLLSL